MSFEPPSDLWAEHSNFLGCSLGGIAYGCFVTLYFITTYKMLHKSTERRRWAFHLAYTFALFVVTTVNVAANIRWTMIAFIDNRNYPGGPLAYSFITVTELIIGNATYVLSNFLTDALVLYRCFIIWQDNYVVIAFPLFLFLASTALSIMMVYQTAQPNASLWSAGTVRFAVPYLSLTISLNIIVTLLISGRLLMLRKQMHKALGPRYARKYTGAVAMLVESAALYTSTGLLFVITYARNSNVQNLVWPIVVSAMPSAPLLILLRVVSGTGFSRNTTTLTPNELSKPAFASGPTTTSSSQDLSTQSLTDNRVKTPTMNSGSNGR